jgi:two-component sensor histidine kinase
MPTRPRNFQERLPLARDMPVLGYLVALVVVAGAAAIRYALAGVLPGYPYLQFFPAIILTAFLFGRGPGILATLVAGALAWLLFIPPPMSFASGFSLVFFAFVAWIDIAIVHWMQRANGRLLAERERSHQLAETREVLFRELQHRVSNNLQVVAALLTIQKRSVEDLSARNALDEAARRLALIGKIHRQLYDPTGSKIALRAFLQDLCSDVLDAMGATAVRCSVEADETIRLPEDATVPLALIVAEAIANAVEHGLAGRDDGTIAVRLRRSGTATAQLTITDDGRGVPPGFDPAQSGSLGLRISTTLARQLGGTFTLTGAPGATAALTFAIA